MLSWFLVYRLSFFTGTIVAGFFLFYLAHARPTPFLRIFRYLLLTALATMVFQYLEVMATTLQAKVWLLNVRFVFYALFSPLFLLFVVSYTAQHAPFWRRFGWLLWVQAAVASLLALTSPWHELFRYDFRLFEAAFFDGRSLLTFTAGPLFQLYFLYAISLGGYNILLWIMAYRERVLRLPELLLTLAAVLVPVAFEMFFTVGLTPFNFGPVVMNLTSVFYWVGLLRYQLFDVRPLARSLVLDQMGDGVVLVDADGRLVDLNPAGNQLPPLAHADPIGRPLAHFLPAWAAWRHALGEQETCQLEYQWPPADEEGQEPASPPTYYKVTITILREPAGQRAGWMLLFHDITAQKENEEQKAQLAAFEERERIGRDLHDDLGQLIGYFNVQTQAIYGLLGQEKIGQARLELAKLTSVAQKSHADVRRYILGLRMAQEDGTAAAPLPAIHADFTAALHHYLDTLHTQYGLEIDLHLPEELPDHLLAPASEMQLLRMIQEALHNVRKHAGVAKARVYLLVDENTVRAIVEDDGCGFDPTADHTAADGQPHFGLHIMRERANTVNGTVKIKSQPHKGTKVTITVPRLLDMHQQASPWRILLADNHPLFREGLRNLLSVRGLQVVGIATNGDEAVTQTRTLQPDLVLMDMDMPVCNGIEATLRIKAEMPHIRIVMLTVSADTETIFAALRAGASGYLLKNLQDEAFYRLLKNIMRGENVVSPELANRILTEFQPPASPVPAQALPMPEEAPPPPPPVPSAPLWLDLLTERQKEVLTLATEGLTYQQIGERLHLSERTIRYHMGQIIETLQVTNRREAVALMRGEGKP